MPRQHYWWSGLSAERYWCEITDRKKPGDDLLCPQLQENGKQYWSYSLILQIQPGDLIFHYHTPSKAFIGASVATGSALPDTMSWVPHGTVGRRKREHAPLRSAWRLPIAGYTPASTPLTLSDIQKEDTWVRRWIAEKQAAAEVVAAPIQPYPGKLRGYQGYLTKMPLAFVNHWPQLKELADRLCGGSYIQELTAELRDDESVLTAAAEDVRHFQKQGFQLSPKDRRAIEDYSMQRAKQHYEAAGYTVEIHGKPYDLRCLKATAVLYVEVKGTTTAGDEILLTPNEVSFADEHSSSMALFIVSDLQISHNTSGPIVAGGTELEFRPWIIAKERLSPVTYSYAVQQYSIAASRSK